MSAIFTQRHKVAILDAMSNRTTSFDALLATVLRVDISKETIE